MGYGSKKFASHRSIEPKTSTWCPSFAASFPQSISVQGSSPVFRGSPFSQAGPLQAVAPQLHSYAIHYPRLLHHSTPSHVLLQGHLESHGILPNIIPLAMKPFSLGHAKVWLVYYQALGLVSDQCTMEAVKGVGWGICESKGETLG